MGLLAMLIAFSLAPGAMSQPLAGSLPVVDESPQVFLTPFVREKTIFDADLARGGAGADIPLAGTAMTGGSTGPVRLGTAIEARIVDADTDAEIHPWRRVATTGPGGAWSGTYPAVPSDTRWLRVEARVEGAVDVARHATSFGAGLVVVFEAQSNLARGLSTSLDNVDHSTITIGNDVGDFQAVWNVSPTSGPQTGTSAVTSVHDGNKATSSLAYAAKVIHEAVPGLKVMAGFLALSGSGQSNLLRDAGSDRPWDVVGRNGSDGLLDVIEADGAQVGVAALGRIGVSGDAVRWASHIFGTDLDGNPISGLDPDGSVQGAPAALVGTSSQVDRIWGSDEMLPGLASGRTKWWWPSEVKGQKPSDYSNGIIDKARFEVVPSVLATPFILSRVLPSPHLFWGAYQRIVDGGSGGEDDGLHWTSYDLRGMPYRYGVAFWGLLEGLGLIDVEPPKFDNMDWDSAGRWVDLWSSAGPVTTSERIKNGGSATNYQYIPNSEVLGLVLPDPGGVNGYSNARTEIVDEDGNPATSGRVRVYPVAGQTFNQNSTVYYLANYYQPGTPGTDAGVVYTGPGAVDDNNTDFQDWVNAMPAEHFPVVAESSWPSHPYGGLVLNPDALDHLSAAGSNAPSVTTFRVLNGVIPGITDVPTGYRSQGTTDDNVGSLLTVEVKANWDAADSLTLFKTERGGITVVTDSSGALRMVADDRNRDSADRWLDVTAPAGTVQAGVTQTIRVALHDDTGQYQFWVDGVEIPPGNITESIPWTDHGAGSQPFRAPEPSVLLTDPDNTGDVSHIAVWANYLTPADRTFSSQATTPDADLWIAVEADGAGGVIVTDTSQ